MLYGNPFAQPVPSMESLEDRPFTAVSTLGTPAEDGRIYVDASNRNVLELGGIDHPSENCGEYYRLDASRKEIYSDANRWLAHCTPGATLRFITDATSVAIDAKLHCVTKMPHFTDRGIYGFDMLIGTGTSRRYIGEKMQFFVDTTEAMKDVLALPEGLKEIQINLPLYGGVTSLQLGFPAEAKVALPTKRAYKPIAFYGSSITQGGCVGRPGNSYCNVVCRALDADCRNMGFSGSAMGEQAVAEYIGGLDLAAFVMDYDYNAPSVEHLQKTHRPFFETIRRMQPELPIIFLPHVWAWDDNEEDYQRIATVRATYDAAIAAGDRNVYFIDSRNFFRDQMSDLCTVDHIHPNDLGQFIMAEEVYKTLVTALKR